VQLLDNENLVNELTTYESALSPTGKLTYNAAKGCHDDMVIATLLSFDLSNKKNLYTVI
jgi:hypothetical protein